MTTKKPTILDVAKLANVSTAAVSMVLSGKGRISPWTAQRINEAIDALGYVRNNNAATLRSGKTGLIAVLIHGMNNKFNLEALQGVNAHLNDAHKVGFIIIYDNNIDLQKKINIAINYNVDGFIIISQHHENEKLKKTLTNCNIPWSFISTVADRDDEHIFAINTHYGTKLATQHLINEGHIHIAFIGGDVNSLDRAEKMAGYFSALRENNIDENKKIIIPDGKTIQETVDKVEQLLSSHPWITAILCYDNTTTRGAIAGIKNRGRTIGRDNYIRRDISLICLEKTEEAEYISPSITCIDFSAYQLGWNAACQLNNTLDGKLNTSDLSTPQPILILRESA